MVDRSIPGWSWEEDFDVPQRAWLAYRIVAELDARLCVTSGSTRLYAATVHPILSRHLRKALDDVAEGAGDFWKVARPRRPDAYATCDRGLFVRILPVLFEFGPPEISILAIAQVQGATLDGMGGKITGAVERCDNVNSRAVRMDFDSGDLVRIV